jgi:hemolysin activation/secretion protein
MRISFVKIRLAGAMALALLGVAQAGAQTRPEPAAIERTIPVAPSDQMNGPTLATPTFDTNSHFAAAGHFTLGAVNIDGATVFSRAELSRFFEPYLASEVDNAKLSEIAGRITQQYRETGYVLSYAVVPPQNVEAGMVRIDVVEGRIGKVTINGAGAEQGAIEAITGPLVHNSPLKGSMLERAMGLIRDLPGIKLTDVALLRTDAEAGIYALKITVKRDRSRGFVYSDNRGAEGSAGMRLYSSASLSSLAVNGDELRVDLFGMPGRGFHYRYGQLLTAVPLGYSGARLTLSASKGDQFLKDASFAGDSTNVSLQFSYPMLRSRKLSLLGKVSVNDWRSLGSERGSRALRDRLRVARLGLEFSRETRTRIQGDLTLSRGLGFGAMTRVGDPLASRPDASGKFTKATLAVQLARPLGSRVVLRGTAIAQYSDRPVLSAEEFSLGGNRIGRAFAFNALAGDRGYGAGAEISYRLSDPKKSRAGVELFGFADGGSAHQAQSSTVTGSQRRSLASVGVGSRFNIGATAFSVEAGLPVARKGLDRSLRLFFSTYRAF